MILTYHEIVSRASPYVYSTTLESLREHLSLLLAVAPESAADPSRITFDDGHKSHYALAAPTLDELRCRATFFVTVGWTSQRPNYMSWSELRCLVSQGHSVQSHGWSHVFLSHCDERELRVELRHSRETLEDRLGAAVTEISMPGGRWNARVLKACADSGYRRLYHSDPFQTPGLANGVLLSGRFMVRRTTRQSDLLALLDRTGLRYSRLRMEHTIKTALHTVLGDQRYHRLWRLLGRSSAHEAASAAAEISETQTR